MSSPFDRKIAIIGCGPSGIFTCYFLNKLGYTNIHLYGDINDAQPKTILVDDIVCDVATIYGHNGYSNSIRRVASEFHFDLSNMAPPKDFNNGIIAKLERPTVANYIDIARFMLHGVLWKMTRDLPVSKTLYAESMSAYINKFITSNRMFLIDAGTTAQGYGFTDNVTAYHLFKWLRPSLFLTNNLGEKSETFQVLAGYGKLFNTIYANLETNRKINQRIIEVRKNHIATGGTKHNKTEEHYDSIFVCCPLSSLKTPLRINKTLHVSHSLFFSYWFESKNYIDISERIYMQDNITSQKTTSILTIRHNIKTKNGDISKCGRHVYGCVGHCRTLDDMKEKSIIQAELRGYQFQIKADLHFKIYKYNYRFTKQAIEEGIHLYVNEQQGNDGLYYLGGMLSHWDVDSIYEHSREVVNQFHLSCTSNPIEKLQTVASMQYNKWIDEW